MPVALATAVVAMCAFASASPEPTPREYRAYAVTTDPRDALGGLDVVAATLGQEGRDLVLAVQTRRAFSTNALGSSGPGTLCFLFTRSGPNSEPGSQVCFGPSHRAVSVSRLSPSGRPGASRSVAAAIKRGSHSLISVRVPLEALGIGAGQVLWQVHSTWGASRKCSASPARCDDLAPDAPAAFALVAVHPIGCRLPVSAYYAHARTARKLIALTFDDGPNPPYTTQLLAVLRRYRVPATFFVLGQGVEAHPGLVREELAAGDAVGNHSFDHQVLSGGGARAVAQITSTDAAVEHAAHYRPCLFRPPYGSVSGALIAIADQQSLATIGWDVDPRDWSLPGSASISARVVGAAHPGAIVLLHDGGGPRDETVAAVPGIVRTLRARGYRFATVPEMLGGSEVYGR